MSIMKAGTKPTDNNGVTPADAGASWDTRYASRRSRVISLDNDPWLERWQGILATAREGKILELGCGSGRDSSYLTGLGLQVIAADYSQAALESCRQLAPLADIRLIDIRNPLPFDNEEFPVIIASLCLHYFSWPATMAIMAEIRRCLKPGGYLLVRVNSTGDRHYGADGHPEVEPGLYNVNGELKRFFDREAVGRLIGPEWKVLSREELTVNRYDSPKVVWEVVLERQVTITRHGRAVARIVPVDSGWKRETREVIEEIKTLAKGRHSDMPIREMIDQGRR
jgi:SAM-dependent methyltransferase